MSRDLEWEHRYVVGFNPRAEADDTLLVARVASTRGNTLATLVNYACHPTTLGWENTDVSPDFVGALRETVEAGTSGALCLFLQGASGELSPREQYSGDTGLADRHGHGIGHAALAALATLPAPCLGLVADHVVESGAPLARWRAEPTTWPTAVDADRSEIAVTPKPLVALEELERRWSDIDAGARAERLHRARHQRAEFEGNATPTYPVWMWRLGELLFVGHPGEAYSHLQQRVRQNVPDASVFVLNLVNGASPGYLPPAGLYDADVYQVWQTVLGAGTLERVTEHAITRGRDLLDRTSQ